MKTQNFIEILSQQELLRKIHEIFGPLIQLTITEVTISIFAKYDNTVKLLGESIELLKMQFAIRVFVRYKINRYKSRPVLIQSNRINLKNHEEKYCTNE